MRGAKDLSGAVPGCLGEDPRAGRILFKEVALFGSACDSIGERTRAEQASGLSQPRGVPQLYH